MTDDSETAIEAPSTNQGANGNIEEKYGIFQRNRSLGYVSNHVPAILRYVQRREDNLIITCTGRAFQVYSAKHVRLLHVSNSHPEAINAMAADHCNVYTACGKYVYAWRSGKHLQHKYGPHTQNVQLLLPFGAHIIAVDKTNVLKVWDIKENEVYLEIGFNMNEFQITALVHPPTYLNKIVLGSQQGELKIWNLKENRLIYTIKGRYASAVTCLESAPALDVVAIGHHNGIIALLNLKFDTVVMSFKQDWGPVSQMSFRTDGLPIIVSGSTTGQLAFWNLEKQQIMDQISAHDDVITTTCYFQNEPLLLTTSPDNSMKIWNFDKPDGGGRLLRVREGHAANPLFIRYHGNAGNSILSSSEDSSLRVFSTISETLNRSMGKSTFFRKPSKKKKQNQDDVRMQPILQFTSEIAREKQWDNIAAIHAGTVQVTTWSFHRNCMGAHRLVPEKLQKQKNSRRDSEATCLTLSHCGNFVIIGYFSGHVERFNIQSGIHRASYGEPVAHTAPVRGVCSDNLNQYVVSGCSAGHLKYWPFKKSDMYKYLIKLSEGVELMRMHRESALIAVALVNFEIYVLDFNTRTIVRKFIGHSAKLNDVTFSPDSRWLISAAMDSTIKIWDIPSSYMVDHFSVEHPCLSLTMSPTGDFLATAHANCLGIYLWANKTLFNPISLHSINPYGEAPLIDLPSNLGDKLDLKKSTKIDYSKMAAMGDEVNTNYQSPAQLSANLITMSELPVSRWQSLYNMDVVKKRNKPNSIHVNKGISPFFLPTVPGLPMQFDLTPTTTNNDKSRVKKSSLINLSYFARILEESTVIDYEKCIQNLKSLTPSAVDLEIKSLHPLSGGSWVAMRRFLNLIEYMFARKDNFELAQTYLNTFLRAHGLECIKCTEVLEAISKTLKMQKQAWKKIEYKFMFSIGIISALRNFSF